MSSPPHRLELRGITKRFPGCLANDQVDLVLRPGEIHALLGENGAGKSTLVKIIYGVLHADAGRIQWNGHDTHIPDPAGARRLGIGMVFQHFSLFDTLTVAENISLGLDQPGPIDALSARIAEVSERYGLSLDPRRHVHNLSVGERQRVEIVRCLLQDPKLLIMDEPTSVLTPQEATRLFETLRRLAAEGCTILYISHKLEEIRALCDTATVLRGGRVVGSCDPRRETARSLAEMMIGTELSTPERLPQGEAGAAKLQVRHLSTTSDNPFATNLKDVSFEVRAGEILGIAGVAGNGQAELMAALSGEALVPDPASVAIEGRPAGHLGPRERRLLGLAFVPEERLGRGAVPELSLSENALLSGYAREPLVRSGLVHFGRARSYAERIIGAFNVVTHGHRAEARSLSGGNLQKFIIGREILQKPRLLVVGQPTWGVDAGAAAAIHRALIDLARAGAAVLVISQDLDELFVLSDRIAVLFHGHLSESRPTHHTSVEEIGLLMGGLFNHPPDEDEVDRAV
ncbi:ABC transporter ATP-binding protein [Azospirillum baldaniorum]|uniref:ABC transporter ATP-binding component n=1 Tax=Azospirillum baldaniorum TaxID=1064539 RepID=A0A9P1NM38_9PROT|nr:ABC transporter ATP-binding protein [Azospirillum baldaniorum]AWJ90132.1 ABC transporter ATP-binding protein [Azospirillum baldaniorum]TWA77324.1 nucleoside ABC transporter ATP-binding protein [Azospirillum brasilense]CCC97812.1 putative ABC transporter; ATP-binding component [Azospirillum baldaniorum]